MSRRILVLIGQLTPGGQERQLTYLLQAMDRDYYSPAVAVWNFNEQDLFVSKIKAMGVPLYPLVAESHPILKLVELRCLIKDLGAEVVHSYSFYTNFAAWVGSLGTRAVAIGSVRSSFLSGRVYAGRVLGRLSARWPRHQVYNSRMAAEQTRSSSRLFAPECLYVVLNGIDLEQYSPSPVPDRNPVPIVGIGSLLPYKRWDLLLIAAKELRRRGLQFHVKIAGNGPSRTVFEQQILEAGLEDHIDLLGYVDDVPGLLAECAFLVHTSDLEGSPNAVIEAMASGRAVVATDAGDVPYIVDNDVTGFVIKRGDPQGLIERMADLITHPELCRRMGQAGRVKAEREFQLARLLEETVAAYRAAGWRDG